MKKIPQKVFYLLLLIFTVCTLINEFLFLSSHVLLLPMISCISVAIWILFSFVLSNKNEKSLKNNLVKLITIIFVFFLLHFLLNSINIYQFEPLPQWFYSFKLYRFISLSGLFWMQILGLLVGLFFIQPVNTKYILSLSKITIILMITLLVGGYTQLQKGLAIIYTQLIQINLNASVPFDARFTYRQGGAHYYGWVYPYTEFIKEYSSDDSVIVIPPQSYVWKIEGNAGYLRWFLYPRKLTYLNQDKIPSDATHLLIALGDCAEGDCGWPKISIPGDKIDKIVLVSRDTQERTIITNASYALDRELYKWGIIVLKRK